jgi:hypothetical protein
MKPLVIILVIFVIAIASVNLVWLGYSSVKVVVANRGVASVSLHVDDEVIELGNLRTGESRFLLLPRRGRTTPIIFSASLVRDELRRHVCDLDVQPTGQHVTVLLYHDRESACSVSSPMTSELIITKFF